RGRAPDGGERLLEGVLGAAAVAEASQRETEDGAGIAPVELLERGPVAGAGPLDQLPIRAHGDNPRNARLKRIRHLRSYGVSPVVGFRLMQAANGCAPARSAARPRPS